jgi:hypothetical protein
MNGNPTSNPDQTSAYIASLQFNENLPESRRVDQQLQCANPSQCGGKTSVRVRVIPEAQSHRVNWGITLTIGNGHILSKITNMDTVAYGRWNIAPNSVAYLWIGEIDGQGRNLGIFHQVSSGYSFIKIAGFKGVCHRPPATFPAAHIYTPGLCHGGYSQAFEKSNRLASNSAFDFTRMLGHDQGLWQGCAQGCCETAFF